MKANKLYIKEDYSNLLNIIHIKLYGFGILSTSCTSTYCIMYTSIPHILNSSKYFPLCSMEEESHTGLNNTRLRKRWQIFHFVVNYLFIGCVYSLSMLYMQEARQQHFFLLCLGEYLKQAEQCGTVEIRVERLCLTACSASSALCSRYVVKFTLAALKSLLWEPQQLHWCTGCPKCPASSAHNLVFLTDRLGKNRRGERGALKFSWVKKLQHTHTV